jgi:hypothetical protein
MANLQVKNVPKVTHAEIRRLARSRGKTLGAFVLELLEREVENDRFWRERDTWEPILLPPGAIRRALEEARREREIELFGEPEEER